MFCVKIINQALADKTRLPLYLAPSEKFSISCNGDFPCTVDAFVLQPLKIDAPAVVYVNQFTLQSKLLLLTTYFCYFIICIFFALIAQKLCFLSAGYESCHENCFIFWEKQMASGECQFPQFSLNLNWEYDDEKAAKV